MVSKVELATWIPAYNGNAYGGDNTRDRYGMCSVRIRVRGRSIPFTLFSAVSVTGSGSSSSSSPCGIANIAKELVSKLDGDFGRDDQANVHQQVQCVEQSPGHFNTFVFPSLADSHEK